MECNFNCRYCYRDECRKKIPKEPTEKFLQYLRNLTADDTYSVIASGGEPLLYIDVIKKVFANVPKSIHKKIMTNGSLLTKDIIQYVNDNNIEVSVSHDGIFTEYLRGKDIFQDKKLLDLCREIKNLVITSVITNKNPDVMEVYQYEKSILKRPFYYNPCAIQPTPTNKSLYMDFNYDIFQRTYSEFLITCESKPKTWYHNSIFYPRCHVNVLLDGTVIGTKTMNSYGTVWDTKEDIIENFITTEYKHLQYCVNKKCSKIGNCAKMVSNENDFSCKISKIESECKAAIYKENGYVGD